MYTKREQKIFIGSWESWETFKKLNNIPDEDVRATVRNSASQWTVFYMIEVAQ